jgi:hypothetical protein
MSECNPGPTSVDFMHALSYAMQQVAYLKCKDPEIVKKICESNPTGNMPAGGGTCIQWRQDEKEATFPKPTNYYRHTCSTDEDCYLGKCINGKCSCTSDADCGNLNCIDDPKDPENLICGYAPDFVAAGHCVINNKQACLSQSQLPYDCSACGPQGNVLAMCTTNKGADGGDSPQYPYLEWHLDDKGQGKCVLGNFLYRKWCESPCSRCPPDKTGEHPSKCDEAMVPPFYYDPSTGKCSITHDYCSHYGMNFNMGDCENDRDCGMGAFCDKRSGKGRCTGPNAKCIETRSQQIGEIFVGRTLFFMLKHKGRCPDGSVLGMKDDGSLGKESFTKDDRLEKQEIEKEIANAFNKVTETVCMIWRPERVVREKVLMKDFGGKGIHIYLFELKNERPLVSFKPEEMIKKYPDNVEKHSDGSYLVCITREDLGNDKFLKRLYLSIGSKSWLTQTVLWAINLSIKSKNKQ